MAHVVACEDNPAHALLIRKALKLIPSVEKVEIFESAGQALLAVERLRPSLVIMDHQMPGASGMDGLKRLRSRPWGRSVPVLVHTAADIERDALANGATAFLKKPARVDQLLAAIEPLLSGTKHPTA